MWLLDFGFEQAPMPAAFGAMESNIENALGISPMTLAARMSRPAWNFGGGPGVILRR